MVFLSAQEPAFAKSPRAQRGGSQAPAPEAAKDKIVPVRSSSATAGALAAKTRSGVFQDFAVLGILHPPLAASRRHSKDEGLKILPGNPPSRRNTTPGPAQVLTEARPKASWQVNGAHETCRM